MSVLSERSKSCSASFSVARQSPRRPSARRLCVLCLVVAALTVSFAAQSFAAVTSIPRKHHPWGRFAPGSWKLVRIVSETFDQNGKVTGTTVTETKTKLEAVADTFVVLTIESTVEIAGKKIIAQPKRVTVAFEDPSLQKISSRRVVGEQEVLIDGKRVRCRILQAIATIGRRKTTVTTYYSGSVAPFVLRRESSTTDGNGGALDSRIRAETIALDMPHRVLADMMTASHVKTVHTHAGGKTVSLAVQVLDVPGGVVSQTSKELDAQGRLIRRGTLELLDYGVAKAAADVQSRRTWRRPWTGSFYVQVEPAEGDNCSCRWSAQVVWSASTAPREKSVRYRRRNGRLRWRVAKR